MQRYLLTGSIEGLSDLVIDNGRHSMLTYKDTQGNTWAINHVTGVHTMTSRKDDTVPYGYVFSEAYRGYAISTQGGRYWAHDAEGFLAAFPSMATVSKMRERIDLHLD